MVDLKPMDPKFPDCFTLKSAKLIQSHLAKTMELHLALHTVLVPVVDQVKAGVGVLVIDVLGGLGEEFAGHV